MAKTSDQLLQQAVQIRDEQANKKNTAIRIGTLFSDIIEKQIDTDKTHESDIESINITLEQLNKLLTVLDEVIKNKPGKIVKGGEIFNHDSNSISDSGVNNHAEGQGTSCNGSCNHAEGMNTKAYSIAAHAEGMNTIAAGKGSHSEGIGTATSTEGAHVEGLYNKITDAIHSIGIGRSDSERKNAIEITKDGILYIINIGNFDGTNRSDSSSLQELISDIITRIKTLEDNGSEVNPKPKGYSRVDLQKNLSSTTLTEAEAPESALRLEAGANILIGKGENGSVVISATYSSSGGDGIIIIQ